MGFADRVPLGTVLSVLFPDIGTKRDRIEECLDV